MNSIRNDDRKRWKRNKRKSILLKSRSLTYYLRTYNYILILYSQILENLQNKVTSLFIIVFFRNAQWNLHLRFLQSTFSMIIYIYVFTSPVNISLRTVLSFLEFFFLRLDSPIRAWASSFRRGFMVTQILDTPQSVGLLWTRDQLVAETSTWQHTTLTRDRHPCPRWNSNPRSQ